MTIQRQPSLRRLDWHYMAMQIGFWAMFASIVGYQTALLLDRGFSNGEAGLMTSVRCLAGIVCQPLLGGFADRHPEFPLKRIVSLSMLLSLGVSVWYWLAPGMGLGETALVWAVIGGLEVSSYPLMDAMAIQFINDGVPIRYSLGRGLGSLAYALTCVFLGFQVGRSGVESTLLTHVVLVAAEIALVATYPPYRGRPRARDAEGPRPQSAVALLRSNPSFTLMLAGVLLSLTAVLPLSNFLVNIVTSRGGTDADLGLAMFVMGAFELPTAFLFPRLLRRFGSGRLLVLSAVFGTLKAVALLCTFNYAGVLLAQPLLAIFSPDPDVLEVGVEMVRFLAPCYITYILIELLTGAIRGAGKSVAPMLISVFGVCGLRLLWLFTVVPAHHTLLAVEASYPITWAVTSVAILLYYRFGRWLHPPKKA